jgi:hypothetical protein
MNDEEQYIRQQWFPKHKASYFKYHCIENPSAPQIETLCWQKPGTGIYAVEYWFSRGTLAVRGDIGAAVYQWHHSIGNLPDLANLSIDYFAGKCEASEHGQGYQSWDEDAAKQNIQYYIDIGDPVDTEETCEAFSDAGGWNALYSKHEWHQWLSTEGYEVFGDICEMGEIGMKIDIRCLGHLVGLKMAFEQLKNLTKESPTQ